MNWWGNYVGIPFVDGGRDADGLDCWGLVCLVYANELDVVLPSYGEVSAADLVRVARSLEAGKDGWQVVDKPRAFDVVAMRFYSGRATVGHVGIMVDGKRMIHTERATAVACVPLTHFAVRDRIASIRRLAP